MNNDRAYRVTFPRNSRYPDLNTIPIITATVFPCGDNQFLMFIAADHEIAPAVYLAMNTAEEERGGKNDALWVQLTLDKLVELRGTSYETTALKVSDTSQAGHN